MIDDALINNTFKNIDLNILVKELADNSCPFKTLVTQYNKVAMVVGNRLILDDDDLKTALENISKLRWYYKVNLICEYTNNMESLLKDTVSANVINNVKCGESSNTKSNNESIYNENIIPTEDSSTSDISKDIKYTKTTWQNTNLPIKIVLSLLLIVMAGLSVILLIAIGMYITTPGYDYNVIENVFTILKSIIELLAEH